MPETMALTFRGRVMTADPVGTRLVDVAARLNQGLPVVVILEPGDHTRYDFVLAPVMDEIIVQVIAVTRTLGGAGGDFHSGALLPNAEAADQFYLAEEYARLARGNAWSAELFAWWFLKLWEAINA